MVHYFKQSCLLMLWALFLVNISFTSCDDKNPEVQIGELTPQKLYQTSWRGTGRCDAWGSSQYGSRYAIYRYSIGESKLGKLR